MNDNTNTAITVAAPSASMLPAMASARSSMDILATMSDDEFEHRLTAMKTAQVRVARVQREMMAEGTDYGKVLGIEKPILMKPGAEKLCKMYTLVPSFSRERASGDGLTAPHIRYESTCYLHVGAQDGPVVAQGTGTANSWEKKYRYRYADRSCPECGVTGAIIHGKAEYGGGWICFKKRDGCGAKFDERDQRILNQSLGVIENPDPMEQDNTILKMSDKRAYVGATLTATATSGLFTQDLLDEPDGTAPPPEPPERPAASAQPARREAPARPIRPAAPSRERQPEPPLHIIDQEPTTINDISQSFEADTAERDLGKLKEKITDEHERQGLTGGKWTNYILEHMGKPGKALDLEELKRLLLNLECDAIKAKLKLSDDQWVAVVDSAIGVDVRPPSDEQTVEQWSKIKSVLVDLAAEKGVRV